MCTGECDDSRCSPDDAMPRRSYCWPLGKVSESPSDLVGAAQRAVLSTGPLENSYICYICYQMCVIICAWPVISAHVSWLVTLMLMLCVNVLVGRIEAFFVVSLEGGGV